MKTNEEMTNIIIVGLKKALSEREISEMACPISFALEERVKNMDRKIKKLKKSNSQKDLLNIYFEDREELNRLYEIWEDVYNRTVGLTAEQLEDQMVKLGILTPEQRDNDRLKRGANNALNENLSDN